MLPAHGYVALYEHQRTVPDGAPQSVETTAPVVAWDDEGHPLVVRDGRLQGADSRPGYVGLRAARAPAVAVLSGGGWRAEFRNDDGTTTSRPLLAWTIRADGSCSPLDADTLGRGDDPTGNAAFVRVYHPDADELRDWDDVVEVVPAEWNPPRVSAGHRPNP